MVLQRAASQGGGKEGRKKTFDKKYTVQNLAHQGLFCIAYSKKPEAEAISAVVQPGFCPHTTIAYLFPSFSLQILYSNGTLSLPSARASSDQGVYQCFASNSVGSAAADPVTLRIQKGEDDLDDEEEEEFGADDAEFYTDEELSFWRRPPALDHLAAVPPSRPEVQQSGR